MHPPVLDRLGRLVGLLPVAEHDGISLRHELAGLAALDRLASRRVGDLDLQVRVDPPDGPGLLLEGVVGAVLRRHRGRLRHPVADRHLLDAGGDELAHQLRRTREPAMIPVRTLDRSYSAKLGRFHSAMNIVGTP